MNMFLETSDLRKTALKNSRAIIFALFMVPCFALSSFAYPLSYFEQTADAQAALNAQVSVAQIGRLVVPRGMVNIDGMMLQCRLFLKDCSTQDRY